MSKWKIVHGDSKPLLIDEHSSQFIVYERRNIQQETIEDPTTGEQYIGWVYEEREYTKEEYFQLTNATTQAIMQQLSQLELAIAELS